MAEATIASTSVDESGHFNARSVRDTQAANQAIVGQDYVDPGQFRKPDYFVYVYSVVDPRPDNMKLRRSFPPLIPDLEIAEAKGSRYVLVTTIASPVNQPLMKENGERYIDAHDARRLAMDIVNPENLTLDQDRKTQGLSRAEGNDYGKLGVFWSLNNPPKEEEIRKAIDRKEAFYRARLDQARVIQTSNPKALDEYITATDHVAADYFALEFPWHQHLVKQETCPNCGEHIRPGAKFHQSVALGVMCVLDWQAAVNAGVKKLEDVPEGKRWKSKSSRSGETAAS
jgi:hypothetical protein